LYSRNQLTELPDWLAQCHELEELDLYDNGLTLLPVWLLELPRLRRLDLRKNPLPADLQRRHYPPYVLI
jgi:internalin A